MKDLDYDRRPEAWEYYRKRYDKNHILCDLFNLNLIIEGKASAQKSKLYSEWNKLLHKNKDKGDSKKNLISIEISGDTDFNFYSTNNSGKKEKFFDNNYRLKYEYLKKWCNGYKLDEKVTLLIIEHLEKVHKEDNLSLMLTTGYSGGLQFIKEKSCKRINEAVNEKGLILYDNICVFIKRLNDEFFKKQRSKDCNLFKDIKSTYKKGEKKEVDDKNKIATNLAKECIVLYLNFFSDIYDYCKKIYGIDNNLVDDMIEYAECSYSDNQEAIIKFLSLIDIFWKQKKNIY